MDLRRERAGEEKQEERSGAERFVGEGERYPEEGDEIDRAGEEEEKINVVSRSPGWPGPKCGNQIGRSFCHRKKVK